MELSAKERQAQIIGLFEGLKSWEEKYRRIIEIGKDLAVFPESLRRDELKVKGCQSQVWLATDLDEQGRLVFQADSDALIVKGLVAMILMLYSKCRPEEILATSPDFVASLELSQHLSPSRANGIFAVVRQIKYYAAAYQALQAKK